MECNKEFAIRAMRIAEHRMETGHYEEALKVLLEARRLFQDLENMSQMLTVCIVHCSAENRDNGLELDWYWILQIEPFSDENIIKKQYKKLALLLHPDKNKFAGAEAAFKLIREAVWVLTDPVKRFEYDKKCRTNKMKAKPKWTDKKAGAKMKAKPKTKRAGKKFSAQMKPKPKWTSSYAYSRQQPKPYRPSIWALCAACRIGHLQYCCHKGYVGKFLWCKNCKAVYKECRAFWEGL